MLDLDLHYGTVCVRGAEKDVCLPNYRGLSRHFHHGVRDDKSLVRGVLIITALNAAHTERSKNIGLGSV